MYLKIMLVINDSVSASMLLDTSYIV